MCIRDSSSAPPPRGSVSLARPHAPSSAKRPAPSRSPPRPSAPFPPSWTPEMEAELQKALQAADPPALPKAIPRAMRPCQPAGPPPAHLLAPPRPVASQPAVEASLESAPKRARTEFPSPPKALPVAVAAPVALAPCECKASGPVSYTHLTLPTICSV
eukprot:5187955-Alexandrium_andersonii.AAC.1